MLKFILDTDASAFALGGILSQVVDGEEKVIAYSSKALSRPEVNYCATHRELLAMVRMAENFRHYLRTDHSSLRWLLHYHDADGMPARWLVKLQTHDFDIEHRPGLQHGNADGSTVGTSGPFSEYQQDETLPVAPKAVGRKLVDMDMNWSSGQGLPPTPGSCLYASGGTGEPQLPPLMTKSHLSSGRLSRVRKLDIQLARN